MRNKNELLIQIDALIQNYGKTSSELLRDLQSHRNAIATSISKKEIIEASYKFANFAKIIYDLFLKE